MDINTYNALTNNGNSIKPETQKNATRQEDEPPNKEDKKLNILIIEDHDISSRVLSLQLNAICQCNIDSATDLKSAMRHLDIPYNIIFTDLHLPDGTAIPFVHEYHQRHPSVPIIAITAYTTEEDYQQLLKNGAVETYIKPINMDVLKQVLQRYTNHYS